MKISLFLVILLSSFSVFSQTQIIFVDINGINGEYRVPNSRSTLTEEPKRDCILLQSADVPFVNKIYRNSSSVSRRRFSEIPEFKIKFILEKSSVEILNKLYNKSVISSISLFYDNEEVVRTEYLKYKFLNSKVVSVIQDQESSGLISVTVTFQYTNVVIGATSINTSGVMSLTKACSNQTGSTCNESI